MSPPLAGRFFTTEPLENPQMPIYLLLIKGDDTFKANMTSMLGDAYLSALC